MHHSSLTNLACSVSLSRLLVSLPIAYPTATWGRASSCMRHGLAQAQYLLHASKRTMGGWEEAQLRNDDSTQTLDASHAAGAFAPHPPSHLSTTVASQPASQPAREREALSTSDHRSPIADPASAAAQSS